MSTDVMTQVVISRKFVTLFCGFFLCLMSLNLFALVPYYLELRGEGALVYGLAAGIHGVSAVFAIMLVGAQADRRSRRSLTLRYFAFVAAGHGLSLLAMPWSSAWYLVVLALQGVMLGVGLPVVFVWAAELCPPERRAVAFGWFGVAGLAADTLGPALGETLLQWGHVPPQPDDFHVVFIAANLLVPLSLSFLVLTPDVSPPNRAAEGAIAAADDAGLWTLLSRAELRAVALAAVAFGGALGVMITLGKNYVVSIGLQFVTALLAAHTIGAILSRMLLPIALARFDAVRMIGAAFVSIAMSQLLLAVASNYAMLVCAGFMYGVGHGLLFPTLLSRMVDYAGAHAAGRVTTLFMGMFSLGFGIAPACGGVVLSFAGFPLLFCGTAMVCLAGWACVRHAERLRAAL
jgi:MFS family permease